MFEEDILKLKPQIEDLMRSGERINANLAGKYWYPLSMATYGSEEVLAALASLCSYRTTMWEKTAAFEEAFASRFGGEAVMVNSGSSADLLAAFSLLSQSGGPLSPGAEILAPSVTWPTQIWSLLMAGFRVKLIDTDPKTLNMDLDDLERKISDQTRGISVVHLMGNPVSMNRVLDICQRYDLLLLEDCCESLGAQWSGQDVGSFGSAGTFSFFFSHHIVTMEGGMITTSDSDLAERLRLLRAHGWSRNLRNPPDVPGGLDPRYTFLSWGFNVRPTELQAGFGLVQLEKFDDFQGRRKENALAIYSHLESYGEFLQLMEVPEGGNCSWFALPIQVRESAPFGRNDLVGFLEREGIETRPVVAGNLASHPAARGFPDLVMDNLPGAELIHDHGFYIGVHPVVEPSQVDRLCRVFDQFMRGV